MQKGIDITLKMVYYNIRNKENTTHGGKENGRIKKCYQELQKRIAEIENRHDTDIMDFINLDDEVKADYMGDWKEKDVQGWEYLVNRASTIRKAYRIVAEELYIGEFLPEIDE